MVWISFERFEFAFEWLESLLNSLNLHSNASNLVQTVWIGIGMVRICIRMVRISFEWFELAFGIPFKWWEFAFEWLESLLNGSNLHSNASNFVRTVWIGILMLRTSFEWFELALEWLEFAFEWLESHFTCWNLHSNCLNSVGMVFQIGIQIVRMPFEWFEVAFEWLERILFEWFEYCSNDSNLHSNG